MNAPNDRCDGVRRHSRIFTHQSLDQLIDDRLFAQLDHHHRFASRSPSVNAEQAATVTAARPRKQPRTRRLAVPALGYLAMDWP